MATHFEALSVLLIDPQVRSISVEIFRIRVIIKQLFLCGAHGEPAAFGDSGLREAAAVAIACRPQDLARRSAHVSQAKESRVIARNC